jgi:phosphoribosylaminoimidazole-succinocarboxamide synthase
MVRRRQLFEGQAKNFFEGPEPGTLVAHFKDDTVFDDDGQRTNKKTGIIAGKGVINNRISEYIMTKLEEIGVPTHFVRGLNMREQLVREVEIIPLKIVVRNVVAGSLVKRFGLPEGQPLSRSIVELYYKNNELDDPIVLEEHVTAFGWASSFEIEEMMGMSLRINDFLSGLFMGAGIRLIDFKIEFGRLFEGDNVRIVLADEISPDGCRLWDAKTGAKLDIDHSCGDMNRIAEGYQEVARRLGIIPERGNSSISGPKLVR